MTIDTKQVLVDLEGRPVKDGTEQNAPDLMLGKVIGRQLSRINAQTPDPLKNWSLGQKFYNEEKVDVSAEDIVFIKECFRTIPNVESLYFPIIVGQVLAALDK